MPLIVVALSLVLMAMPRHQSLRHRDRRHDPAGHSLAGVAAPALGELDTLLPLSLACFLLAYNEGIAAARLLALRHEYPIDPNRELLGLGAANVAIALGHGFPSAGRPVAIAGQRRGARAHAGVARRVLGVDGHRPAVPHRPLRPLPQPLLAALVLASVQSMFKIDELRQLLRVSKAEFVIAMVTIARGAGRSAS